MPGSYGVVNQVSVLMSVADPAPPNSLLHTQLELKARVGIEQGFVKFTTPKLPSHHQRRVTHNYRTPVESDIETGLSSTRDNSKRKQQLLAKKTEVHFTLALSLALFPPYKRGEARFEPIHFTVPNLTHSVSRTDFIGVQAHFQIARTLLGYCPLTANSSLVR